MVNVPSYDTQKPAAPDRGIGINRRGPVRPLRAYIETEWFRSTVFRWDGALTITNQIVFET